MMLINERGDFLFANFFKCIMLAFSFIPMLFVGVSYGGYTEVPPKTPETVEVVNEIDGDTTLAATVKTAKKAENTVQARFINSRSAVELVNSQMVLTHELTDRKDNNATLADKDGNVYIADSFDTYYVDTQGNKYFSSDSKSDGRMNVIRLGKYYYDCHIRDFDYDGNAFKVDKNYHIYSDRLYWQNTLLAVEATQSLAEFGAQVKIPAETVEKFVFADKNGKHETLGSIDGTSAQYVAFDIKNVGVVGFIVPSDGSTKSVKLELENGNYVLTQIAVFTSGAGVNKYDETGGYNLNGVTFGCRIYTDKTHSFDGVASAAYLERNPLEGIRVESGNSDARYLGYDALRGTYTLTMNGTDFQSAYDNPNRQFSAPIEITCDGYDRDIYIRSFGKSGCLEAAVLLDDKDVLVPVDVQVCKNFAGDGGEEFYSVKDYQYGDAFFPISIKADETLSFTLLNLYQNWGHMPLKQLSSIEFHVSYYHLSTGCTESNCIAPYFVSSKDGWTLPDFRTRSGVMWSGQPQFNSVGILRFVNYTKKLFGLIETEEVLSEYVSGNIASTGLAYSDITNEYVSDCGSYTYTLRHVEMPQTDENRTYYTVEIKFNRDVSFASFKRDFNLFYFDGRFVKFDKVGYLDEDNKDKVADINRSLLPKYYTLGDNCPYFSLFDVTDDTADWLTNSFGCNFSLIVRDYSVVSQGKESDVPLAFRDSSTKDISIGCLTLDADYMSFAAGDSIYLNMILLPWGDGTETENTSTLLVREDSALNPVTITPAVGQVVEDTLVPRIKAENGVAEFTVKGGRNNIAVRIDGFTSLTCPDVYVKNGAEWIKAEVSTEHGYDGYYVHYNDDGTYSFSFVYTSDNPLTENTFRIVE